MDRQQIFDDALAHMRRQKRRAMMADGENCAYEAEDGSCCAIGSLMTPDIRKEFRYCPFSVKSHIVSMAVSRSGFGPILSRDKEFLRDVQRNLHDLITPSGSVNDDGPMTEEAFVAKLEKNAAGLAVKYGLVFRPLS